MSAENQSNHIDCDPVSWYIVWVNFHGIFIIINGIHNTMTLRISIKDGNNF